MSMQETLSIRASVLKAACEAGVDARAVAEAALDAATREARNRHWREENADKLGAYAAEVARHGLALADRKLF